MILDSGLNQTVLLIGRVKIYLGRVVNEQVESKFEQGKKSWLDVLPVIGVMRYASSWLQFGFLDVLQLSNGAMAGPCRRIRPFRFALIGSASL